MLQNFTKIGFWDDNNKPIVSKDPYLNGFLEKIKEWDDSLKEFNNTFRQELEIGYIEQYMGYSWCRVCEFDRNGDSEVYYIRYMFPVGYLHYIIDHNIEVPVDFQEFVLQVATPKVINKTAEKMNSEMKINIFKMMGGMASVTYK